jgi:hypothetical protein
MIRYALVCEQAHPFEAWFGSSDSYDQQAADGLVECPFCGSIAIRKQVMAPAVVNSRQTGPGGTGSDALVTAAADAPSEAHAVMMEVINRVRSYVETHFEDVGDRFAAEARDIHEGVADDRPIYGQATGDEVRALIGDGLPVAPLPVPLQPRRKLN